MSAIISLFLEVFSYGITIFCLILFLLCYIIDNFTHNVEFEDVPAHIVYDIDVRGNSDVLLFVLYLCNLLISLFGRRSETQTVLYPTSFKK